MNAADLLARFPILDGHNDLPYEMRDRFDYDLDAYNLDERQSQTRTDLVRLRHGGVGGQFWSVFVPSNWAPAEAVVATIEQIDFVRRMIERYPHRLALATSADDVERAMSEGRVASLLGAEGGHSIDSSLAVLRALHALGVRYLTLTHNDNTPWADSATDLPEHGGLTDFGRDVVRELNRLGVLVDLSHVATTTMRAALEVTRAPVIFSHSSARALTDHVRNVPDDVLAKLSINGGVCMVTFVPKFVSAECLAWDHAVLDGMDERGEDRNDWDAYASAARSYSAVEPPPAATVAQVADHVEHVRDVAGIAHVGLGGDFDGSDQMPEGLSDVSTYPALIEELLDRGWSENDLALLTSRNILRALHDAEHAVPGPAR